MSILCPHLAALERELIQNAIAETFRGAAWSRHCREWVYFRCVLDCAALRARFDFAECVIEHQHNGTHDGNESGFVCTECEDAIMGAHPLHARDWPVFS